MYIYIYILQFRIYLEPISIAHTVSFVFCFSQKYSQQACNSDNSNSKINETEKEL